MVNTRLKKRKFIDTQANMNRTSSKKRKSLDTQIDIISDLPNDVLYRIMERLPLQDAARMSILSPKWQEIWTSTPFLDFDAEFFKRVLKTVDSRTDGVCNIVSKILFQREGPIFKFALFVPYLIPFPDVNPWISYLSRSGVRDLNICYQLGGGPSLSWRLFACHGLEKLRLSGCSINPPPKFKGFPKLTSFELHNVNITYSRFNDLIQSCPGLQNLALTDLDIKEQRHIVIDAPSLRNFVIDGYFDSLDVKNGENLVSVAIVMLKQAVIRHNPSSSDLINILGNSSKLERLCFGGHSCKALFKRCEIRNTSQKLKDLVLRTLHLDNITEFSSVIRCIQSFPNIQTLKISVVKSSNLDESSLNFNPDCTLQHLSCAEVKVWSASSTELKLIEFLLACSPVLEKLSVSFDTNSAIKPSSHCRMLMQLNRFRRVSQKVEVLCSELLTKESSSSSSEYITSDDSSSLGSESDSDTSYEDSSSDSE